MVIQFLIALLGFHLVSIIDASIQLENKHDKIHLNVTSRNIYLSEDGFISFDHKVKSHNQLGIVNGQPAARGQFCYSTYLQFTNGRSYWSCGGSLVNPSTVLTAAHCVDGATSAVVVVGGLDLSQQQEPGRKILKVPQSGLVKHPQYNAKTAYNDIAVIKLSSPVELNENICTVKLPSCSTSGRADVSDNYTVSGWGKISDRKTTSRLMYVRVPGEAHDSCASFYRRRARYNLVQSQLCTSGEAGRGTCNGDSGGPLVQPDLIQRGIVSLGTKSCELRTPNVYTDLTHFIIWLCTKLD